MVTVNRAIRLALVLGAILGAANQAAGATDGVTPPVPPVRLHGSKNATPVTAPGPTQRADSFASAISLLRRGDADAAWAMAARISVAAEKKLVQWIAIHEGARIPHGEIIAFMERNPDWPSADSLMKMAEKAVLAEQLLPKQLAAYFSKYPPLTGEGVLAHAGALRAMDQTAAAKSAVLRIWTDTPLGVELQRSFLEHHGSAITDDDHWKRAQMLVFRGNTTEARQLQKFVRSQGRKNLLTAAIAVIARSGRPDALLNAVPGAMRADPLYQYAQLVRYRQKDDAVNGRRLLAESGAARNAVIYPAAWWEERRILARLMLRDGKDKQAYEIASEYRGDNESARVEAELLAGWIALRRMARPELALTHFVNLKQLASIPGTIAAAHYWAGRALEAMDRKRDALEYFRIAAMHPTTYYGQLATSQANMGGRMEYMTGNSAEARRKFSSREPTMALRALLDAGALEWVAKLAYPLARNLEDPQEVELVAEMLYRNGQYYTALVASSIAGYRGFPLDRYAYPVEPVPGRVDMSGIERALALAVARQESQFRPDVVSGAGAVGLMQLLPSTARMMAGRKNMKWRNDLLTDPEYNARLGAAYLAELMEKYDGSIPMVLAAYNAGPARVDRWIKAYGDPRSEYTDVVDWIESIPFPETQEYVKKVTANLSEYRVILSGNRKMASSK